MFTGWLLRSYGRVSSPAALAFIADRGTRTTAASGYMGEGAVLEATSLGLGTCWIGGGVRRDKVARLVGLGPDERVVAISALGYVAEPSASERAARTVARAKQRRPLDEIAQGHGAWPEWARAGLELVRIAPSATNRQPWCFRMEDGAVVLSYGGVDTPYLSKRLDCGIAMLHLELGARSAGAIGTWEWRDGRDVALWRPSM
jgi:hypothetical protein